MTVTVISFRIDVERLLSVSKCQDVVPSVKGTDLLPVLSPVGDAQKKSPDLVIHLP